MKDSQQVPTVNSALAKYIKADNERFSTGHAISLMVFLSISRLIMKDSQPTNVRQ